MFFQSDYCWSAFREGGVRLQVSRMRCFLKQDYCMPLIPFLSVKCMAARSHCSSQVSSRFNDCSCWPSPQNVAFLFVKLEFFVTQSFEA